MPHEVSSPTVDPDEFVRFMLRPESYPDRPASVTMIETHISRVFLTDTLVYKTKKAIRFPFLDYSSLELREQACQDELRLNARLAPEVYRSVLPVTTTPSGKLELGGQGPAVEYCVVMTRLPAERMLDRLIAQHRASKLDIDRILDVLLAFYRTAKRSAQIDRYAMPDQLDATVRENLKTLGEADPVQSRAAFQRVRSSQLQFVQLNGPLFVERVRAGYVCEGHGDLRPEHICMLDPPVAYDCVEFSLGLRAADVVSELAFLAVECELLGAADLAGSLIEEYLRRSGDSAPDRLLSFYKSYRACVRAKVELLRAGQQSPAAARQSRDRAQRYLQFASYSATAFYRPKLFVMVGAAGTGKSTVADALAHRFGLEVLRTDAVRHELTGRSEPDAPYGQGIYSADMTEQTYDAIFRRADALLREAVSVVLDGSFREVRYRDRAAQLARLCGADLHFLYCRCPSETARRRIAQRLAHGESMSDARPDMHHLQQRELDSADWSGQPVISLDTSGSVSSAIDAVVASLRSAAGGGNND